MPGTLNMIISVREAHAASAEPREPFLAHSFSPAYMQGWGAVPEATQKGTRRRIEIFGRTATPAEILLGSLNHPALRLRKPIPLKIDREDEHVVAAWQEFDEFGYGAHLTVALEDFRQTLVELYLSLEADQKNLGPELQALWHSLQEWIVKK